LASEIRGAIGSSRIRIAGAVTSIDRIRNDPNRLPPDVRIGEAPMLQHMWHTVHDDALAIGIVAMFVAIALWPPFIFALALIARGFAG
jgi:hypothetical protein